VELIVRNARTQRFAATAPAIVGLVVLLLSATSVFGQLQYSLNTIFNVRWKRGILVGWLYKRFLSLLMVLAMGIVLLATVVVTSAIAVAFRSSGRTAQIIDLIISVVVFTIIFVIVFRVLPDIRISWGDTWVGGLISGLLFVAGEYGIGEYLRSSGTTSVYGAAGSLVILLLWIYYSSIILFLGAELTQAYATCCGHEIVPNELAEWEPETARRLRQKQEQAQEAHAGVES
jgi:membrane protein